MNCKICEWICNRLGCFNIQPPSVVSRQEKLLVDTQKLDEILGGIESSKNKLEHVATDINIQKIALESFAKDIMK